MVPSEKFVASMMLLATMDTASIPPRLLGKHPSPRAQPVIIRETLNKPLKGRRLSCHDTGSRKPFEEGFWERSG
jgi:hypothetical protein